ncbi:hypothetical protein [Carboxylicivirga taeanensis]|uniref:hypothetical protein n=1 Tax=Carboxylicivirga taeanensis TaxID=1416875 RepID=UPI003F6E433B
MLKLLKSILLIIFCLSLAHASAQEEKPRKRKKASSDKEVQKEPGSIDENEEVNAFNPLQKMGAKQIDRRDDLLWHSGAANTVYDGAGNISLMKASRYGLKPGLELSSYLLLNYWMPNISLKKRWRNETWYVASKHGLYSATPGLRWFNKRDYPSIVDNANHIPIILSMNNELVVSRLIMNDGSCGRAKPYIIFTGGIGLDFGVPLGDSDLTEMQKHFLTNRSPALTGSGYTAYLRARVDWQMTPMFQLGADLHYFRGNFSGNGAIEHRAELQALVLPKLSISLGYALSLANYTGTNSVGILPLVDVSYYFGKRQGRQKGLFGNKMF